MERRDFLRATGAASLSLAAPGLVLAAPRSRWDRVLVLVELAGGNDGLNTVVPHADPSYARLRPRLGIEQDRVLRLTDALGFHPSLEPLVPAWKANELSVVLGVGYERPNRSHFRSIDIWETASESDQYLTDGWLARTFDKEPPPEGTVADGIVIGREGAGPFKGHEHAVSMRSPDRFLRQARRMDQSPASAGNAALAHLLAVQSEVRASADRLSARLEEAPPLPVELPDTELGGSLATVARLLSAGVRTPAFKIAQGGYDTHARQEGTHERLLGELADALAAFRLALVEAGHWDRVLVMTYSEFGRRAAENGSRGTDHGTAAPQLVLGGRVRGGIIGKQPSLTELSSGDLRHSVDFRRLYQTIVRSWWELPSRTLGSTRHRPLDLLRG